jgi:murein DD-endopeptidase MepM/ murein hydrolase activator NlpD
MHGTVSPQSQQRLRCCWGLLLLICLISWHGVQAANSGVVYCQLADGFDFPVGKPNGEGYYKSRGYWPNGHLGEDWNGKGGGNSDLGAPIYSIARGVVVISDNFGGGWGNSIIVRHAYRDASGKVAMVDSQYTHLHQRHVRVGQIVEKGQLIGTMGGNNGMYFVHLHFELRKNLRIGMNRTLFARDNTNYYSPSDFINKHRRLSASFQKYPIPLGLFAPYGQRLTESNSQVPVLPKTRSNLPATGPSDDDEDFWSKLRARLKQGKIIENTTR